MVPFSQTASYSKCRPHIHLLLLQASAGRLQFGQLKKAGLGGALVAHSCPTTSIANTSFTNNTAAVAGGAVLAYDSYLHMAGCTLAANTATEQGGAVSLQQLTALAVLVEGCVMRGNKAGSGGAVYGTAPAQVAAAPAVSSRNSSSNSTDALDSSSNGTAVFASAAAAAAAAKTPIIAIVNTQLTANQAVAGDGGSAAFSGPLNISLVNTTATDSTATGNGGVLSCGACQQLQVSASQASRCSAGSRGGALFFSGTKSTVSISGTELVNSSAGLSGGALSLVGNAGSMALSDVVLQGNRAAAGLNMSDANSTAALQDTSCGARAAPGGGAACIAAAAPMTVSRTRVTGNSAPYGGE